MKIKTELDIAWSRIANQKVRVVCFPLPPVPTKGEKIIYMPDSYMSRVGDKDQRFTTSGISQENVLGMIMTENGPAIVVNMKLCELIEVMSNLQIHPRSFAICARVTFYPFIKSDGYQYVDKVSIDSLRFGSSCNKASHYVIPQAPYLTALLQFQSSPKREYMGSLDDEIEYMTENKIHYMSPQEVELMFPWINWGRNNEIDSFVSKCLVDVNVSYYRALTGIGEWAKTYLYNIRHNRLKKKEDLINEVISQSFLSCETSKAIVQRQCANAISIDENF